MRVYERISIQIKAGVRERERERGAEGVVGVLGGERNFSRENTKRKMLKRCVGP